MTRDEIDTLWNQALQETVKAHEPFTRYRFAALVAAHEREAIAKKFDGPVWSYDYREIAAAIRARGKT
jgi:hypothetical protein